MPSVSRINRLVSRLVCHEFASTLVVNSRTDILKSPSRKDRHFEIVSHFLVKQGKIVEWTDHVYSWKEV